MNPERSARALSLFEQVLDLGEASRGAYLDRACEDDPELRALVLELLRADARPHGLLDRSPLGVADAVAAAPGPSLEGICIGPYCTIRELGRGGMGVVYLAERDDVGMQVALKVLSTRFASPEVVDRFDRERRVLARLEHPHIARFLDTGIADDGTPWLAMEYVEGQPIDVYCDHHGLTLDERLALFEKVGEAVAHAHRSLLVHRDIKPSNVLVTTGGEPKLLDFGIAKLLEDEGSEGLTVSHGGAGPMTPEYASPEQLRAEPITTSSDVYQLGILLHCLLTGRRPAGSDGEPLSHTARMAHAEPVRPSRLFGGRQGDTGVGGDPEVDHISARRGLTATRLRRRLEGDLDTIVGVALRPEASARYASAQQLVDDVRRHRTGRPILARSGSLRYRLGKFVRRHRAAATLVAVTAATLVAAGVVTAFQARRLAHERDQAEQVAQVLETLVNTADPTTGYPPGSRDVVARVAAEARAGLAADPETWGRILVVVGRVYRNLGAPDTAMALWSQAWVALEPIVPDDHPVALELLSWLGATSVELGDMDQGMALLERAVGSARGLDGARRGELAEHLVDLGFGLQVNGELDRAEVLYREAMGILLTLPDSGGAARERALMNTGYMAASRGDLARAADLFRQVLTRRRATLGPEHGATLNAQRSLAASLLELGRTDEAATLASDALTTLRRLVQGPNQDLAMSLELEARVHLALERAMEAEALAREGVAMFEEVYGESHVQIAYTLLTLGNALTVQGRMREAAEVHRRALDQYRAFLGEDHASTRMAEATLAGTELRLGRPAVALALYERALPSLLAERGSHPALVPWLAGYGEVLGTLGRCEEGRRQVDEASRRTVSLPEGALAGRQGRDAIGRAESALADCA